MLTLAKKKFPFRLGSTFAFWRSVTPLSIFLAYSLRYSVQPKVFVTSIRDLAIQVRSRVDIYQIAVLKFRNFAAIDNQKVLYVITNFSILIFMKVLTFTVRGGTGPFAIAVTRVRRFSNQNVTDFAMVLDDGMNVEIVPDYVTSGGYFRFLAGYNLN